MPPKHGFIFCWGFSSIRWIFLDFPHIFSISFDFHALFQYILSFGEESPTSNKTMPAHTRVSTEVTFGRSDLSASPLQGLTGAHEHLISNWRDVPQGSPQGQALRALLLRGTSVLHWQIRDRRFYFSPGIFFNTVDFPRLSSTFQHFLWLPYMFSIFSIIWRRTPGEIKQTYIQRI